MKAAVAIRWCYLYVPHQIFERRPLLVMFIGAAGLVMSLVFFALVLREYRGFGKQPEKVDLTTITPPSGLHGKWVEVTQPLKIYCEPVEIENEPDHQFFFGRVESTYFQAEIVGSHRFIVLERDKQATCRDVKATPLIGVLTEVNPRLRSTLEGQGMVFQRNAFVMLLCLSCGPKQAETYLLFLPIIAAVSLWLTGRSWRPHLQQSAKREGYLPVVR